MRFGLFGSAQARRGGPDVDSGAGFREFVENNVKAEALGYVGSVDAVLRDRLDHVRATLVKNVV